MSHIPSLSLSLSLAVFVIFHYPALYGLCYDAARSVLGISPLNVCSKLQAIKEDREEEEKERRHKEEKRKRKMLSKVPTSTALSRSVTS